MQELKERILREGKVLGGKILKVDSFINHQIDPLLMALIGKDLALKFAPTAPTKVLTAEVSGIAPAIATAAILKIPLIFARKIRPVTMPEKFYLQRAPSHTKGQFVDLMVSSEFLEKRERVLIIDDFLASGQTLKALADIVIESGSMITGIGVIIEKTFDKGRSVLAPYGVPIESVVAIKEMSDEGILFA
ncbi:MAG: xanthine phosphoribosyltransferase [Candidatus Eremiobacteraeota bacterium]|nr:xanthine phosphoribosyltransferase [Candidatus Eremiobacteraeota bacterium]